ncbi:MAG: DUF2997 domain-containing protein [Polyangiaceae bacterium]|nr:DUF2997 domain-containing protein [Polyangiaceae bacterium]
MKKMQITIGKDGTHTIEVLGARGDECLEFTAEMERRLGAQVGERELKPEYELEGELEAETDHEVEA